MDIHEKDSNEKRTTPIKTHLVTSQNQDKLRDSDGAALELPQQGRKSVQYFVTFGACLIGMQSGMALGWTSPILPYFASKESFIPNPTEEEVSWITSLLALGAILGAVPSGKVADRIGRKLTMGLAAIPFLCSWTALTIAQNIVTICVSRFVGGIGAGAALVLVPVYIGEIAEASIRGALGSCFPMMFSLGIVFSYVMGAYLSYVNFNISCCVVSLVFIVIVPFLPESPMWLVHHDRKRDALRMLRLLRGPRYDTSEEICVLQEEAERVGSKKGGIIDLIGTKAGRKAIITCIGLMWFQQMSGIDALLFYTVTIFQDAGSTIEPFLATIIIGLIEVVMTIGVATIIDRFGRKPLLVISGIGMTLCLGVLGYYFKLKEAGEDVLFIGWLPLTSLSLYNIVFSIGYGSVPFAIISELFPPETKGVAISISIIVHWSLVFAVTKLFPAMDELIGQAMTFWSFGCFTAISAIFAFFFIPETKGKTLQEIQTKLQRKERKIAKHIEPA